MLTLEYEMTKSKRQFSRLVQVDGAMRHEISKWTRVNSRVAAQRQAKEYNAQFVEVAS